MVELVDRLETRGYVRRVRGREDRRRVLVVLQPRGEKLLQKVVGQRLIELRSDGRALVNAISPLLEARGTDSPRKKRPPKNARATTDKHAAASRAAD
jgi:DNA-binding MarR family transcriptional regulator